jgi:hypothetical protein
MRRASLLIFIYLVAAPAQFTEHRAASISGFPQQALGESIADAKTPLQITWFGGNHLDLPVYR